MKSSTMNYKNKVSNYHHLPSIPFSTSTISKTTTMGHGAHTFMQIFCFVKVVKLTNIYKKFKLLHYMACMGCAGFGLAS